MKKSVKNIIQVTIFIAIGIVLFYLVYKDFDFKLLLEELRYVNYWWFILAFVITMASHASRAIRWQMLLDTDGNKTRFSNTFFSVLNGYFVNLAIPRLGEVTRCGLVSRYEKINFSKVLGTMVSERLIDVAMVFILTIVTFLLQSTEIREFLYKNPNIGDKIDLLLSPKILVPVILVFIVLFIFIIFIGKGKFNKIKIFEKISNFIKGFWNGFISLKDVKKPIGFIIHSILIWVLYFMVFYVCFFAFSGFEHLGVFAALTVFVASSFGMLAPAPNGIGAYHFMVIQALMIYGISNEKAAIFALVVHTMQTLFIVIAGIASFIVLPIINRDK